MKHLIRRAYARLRRQRDPVQDVDVAAPLTHLLNGAEPGPDLFAQIEARIDAEALPKPARVSAWVALAFACGLALGVGGVLVGRDRQAIVARPNPDVDWVPLGTVTLHGSALRTFVKTKCFGHTHFFITMHGVTDRQMRTTDGPGAALMAADEKILMECIF